MMWLTFASRRRRGRRARTVVRTEIFVWGKGRAFSGMEPAPVRCGKGRELPALGVEGIRRGGLRYELTRKRSYESWTSVYERSRAFSRKNFPKGWRQKHGRYVSVRC